MISLIGIDLAKTVFHLHALDESGKLVFRKRLSRPKLKEFIVQVKPCRIVMEACGGAHYWAREFTLMGHKAQMIAPQFVTPFRKSSKNDYNDAEAICEAALRPNMRYVPIKQTLHQNIQALHRLREQVLGTRTAVANEIRGLLLEYGVCLSRSLNALRKALPELSDDKRLDPVMQQEITDCYERIKWLDAKIKGYDKKLEKVWNENEPCQRLAEVEGVGVITATAFFAAFSEPNLFDCGRSAAACLGLVPGQDSTGGKEKLLPITKKGDSYLRKLLVHGARSYLITVEKRTDKKAKWAIAKKQTKGFNKAAVAVANKNARTLWALLAHGTSYKQAA